MGNHKLGKNRSKSWQWIAPLLLLPSFCAVLTPRTWAADSNSDAVVTVQTQTETRPLVAYGQVEPMALIRIRALDPGNLSDLSVLAGSAVTKDEKLAQITGPRMQALLAASQGRLRGARAHAKAALAAWNIARDQFTTHLATRQAVDAAKSELTAARAAVKTTAAQLQEVLAQETLRSPVTGIVVAVSATNGNQTIPGETIVTVSPKHDLWIRSQYYGAAAALLQVGMSGHFQPSEGNAVPVKVISIAPSLSADGGRTVILTAASSNSAASWRSGQWGNVTLAGPAQQMIPVPTTALILDRGSWWVLVHTAQGDHPQKVVPGPTHGWQTWIASGLQSGQQIVTQNAYLEFHRDIARTYEPPD